MKTNVLTTYIGVLAIVACSNVMAYQPGDMVLRIGTATVSPQEDSEAIDVAGLTTLDGAGIASDTQLGINFSYMITANIGVALLAATPFSHDITINGTDLNGGEATHLPPTLTVQYYFANPSAQFQPYIGVGINHTIFFEEDVSSELDSALDSIVGVPAGTIDGDLTLDDSTGVAVQLGFDWEIAHEWLFSGTIYYLDIDTEATIKTDVAAVNFDVDIDPMVYMLGFAYKF